MTGHFTCCFLRYTPAHHISDSGAAQIVKEQTRHPRSLHEGIPCLAKIFDRLAISTSNEKIFRLLAPAHLRHELSAFLGEAYYPAFTILCLS